MCLHRVCILLIGLNSLNACISHTETSSPKQLSSITNNISQLALEKSKVLGNKGKQYEQKQHYDKAVTLTRQAIFKAQEAGTAHALVLLIGWQWQLGRIFKPKAK